MGIASRSIQGTHAYGTKPYYREADISLIGAISLKGFLGSITVKSGTNGVTFQVFVEKIFLPCLWLGTTVVMDNLSARKVKGISELIEAAGVRLPICSLDLNPSDC
jgi:transposase